MRTKRVKDKERSFPRFLWEFFDCFEDMKGEWEKINGKLKRRNQR